MCYYPDIKYTCGHRFPRPVPVIICKARADIILEYASLEHSEHSKSFTESAENKCPINEPSLDKAHVYLAARRCDCCILDDMEMIMEAQKEFRSQGIRNLALWNRFKKLNEMVGVVPEVEPEVVKMGEGEARLVPAEDRKAPTEAEEAPPGRGVVTLEIRMGPPRVKAESAVGVKRKERGCLAEVGSAGDAKRRKGGRSGGVYAGPEKAESAGGAKREGRGYLAELESSGHTKCLKLDGKGVSMSMLVSEGRLSQ